MFFEFFVGRRYMKAKQKQTFISLITVLSTAGVAVGVMALIVVIAVMSGFEADLKSRILGGQSHISLTRYGRPFDNHEKVIEIVESVEGVEAATPFIYTQVMLKTPMGLSGAVLRGIDPESSGRVLKTLGGISFEEDAGGEAGPEPGIVLGSELAGNLGISKGDVLYVISSRGALSPVGHVPAMKRFRVAGFFKSGLYEFDGSFAYIHLHQAQNIMRMPGRVSGVDIRVSDIYQAKEISKKIDEALGFSYFTRDWMEMNQSLFSALKIEKTAMFVILTLIILVAAFNIASALIMMVMEKTRDIAILKAMGAPNKSIRRIFVFRGMATGLIGSVTGMGLGFLLCGILKRYKIFELPGEVYYFSTKLPVKLEMTDVALIMVSAVLICFLATLYPSHKASELDPVEAVRYN
ncbi:Lipoprotein-releasing system transmembrane subunit LolC [Candidatus Desulfarcum epimagneticum]|uniref:Lipoprotein-releasing system transmembrane subunit LolC n=1 Tax=uncultured Desulfobacteraceae bacterium TaxID=218296 RepID=A0A484HF96_9BACT|nr:Lipoprotein-releasing system transmembrane subunit LolC [uncultured Desulfobacteraceae bacterium]